MPDVFGIVLAGGEGKRLAPLTADRAKPAVPFGGNYRLIDFALSNLVNAGYRQIVVLTQYKSHSLDRHISTTWRLSPLLGNYVAPVPAQMRRGPRWFSGSADAIYQNLNLLYDERPDIVAVFGADHIYRMDPRQMVDQHIESGAAVTVAALRAPLAEADQFGVIETAADGQTITAFREKPTDAVGLADAPDKVFASMGNYVFSADALIDIVTRDADDEGSKHDMGGSIVPALVESGEAHVYDFSRNEVPGASEVERGYWRDVGTLDAFYDAHMDLISVEPEFNLYNREWPILTWPDPLPPAKFVFDDDDGRRGDGAGLDGVRRRRHLRRHRAPLGPVPRRAPALLRRGRGLGAHAGRRRRAQRRRAPGHRRQERAHRRGRPGRRRPGRRPRALHDLARAASWSSPRAPRSRREGRAPHPRVPARRLRRGRGARRVPGARAAQPDRGRRPLPGAPTGPAPIGHEAWDALDGPAPELAALRAMSIDLTMAAGTADADLVHSHTWYANFGGHLAKLVHDIPHVVTVHSLEPLRPWKAEQLGGGYALSSFCERTAVEAADAIVAVSEGMRADLLDAYPAIDPDRVCTSSTTGSTPTSTRPTPAPTSSSATASTPTRRSIVFVGRITRQKGVAHLLEAMRHVDAGAQLVLCAGAPDTPEIGAEVARRVEELQAQRGNVLWLNEMLPKPEVIQILSHATVFACPSIYEPLGIVNLEAMACETAVVATATGGIVEVVDDGATGLLVPIEPGDDATGEPRDPAAFAAAFAEGLNAVVRDPARAAEMGRAGRARAVERFAWPAIAQETVALYRRLL